MPRRKPVTAGLSGATVVHSLSADDLDELMTQAGVPDTNRTACARDINEHFDFYCRRVSRRNSPDEASQAESLRLVGDAARGLVRALGALPPALRLAIEPDYRVFVRRMAGIEIDPPADAAQEAADEALLHSITLSKFFPLRESAAREIRKRDAAKVEAEFFGLPAHEFAESPRHRGRCDAAGAWHELLARAGAALPLEWVVAALIETADKHRAKVERQVSRSLSKRRATHWRNDLALNLKAIGMAYSQKLANDERAAEGWAGRVLITAEVRIPDSVTNPARFRAMFAR